MSPSSSEILHHVMCTMPKPIPLHAIKKSPEQANERVDIPAAHAAQVPYDHQVRGVVIAREKVTLGEP
jgi:hypothetical protein